MPNEDQIERLQRDTLQQRFVHISRDLRSARSSLVEAVSGLTARGEKLEKLANLGAQLSDYAVQMNRSAAQRSGAVKFRVALALFLSALIVVSTGLWIYANPNTPQP